jgi:hypothetical protein
VYRETNRYEWSYSQKYQKLSLDDIRSTEKISLKTATKIASDERK